MKSKEEEYCEILLEPYSHYEGFVDFVVSRIESCIEEISTPYHLQNQESKIADLDLAHFFLEAEQHFRQIVIRTFKDPLEILILLRDFSKELSDVLGEKVDFGFGFRICKNQDWIDCYKKSILPVAAGKFYIRPSWCEKSSKSELRDIIIDPALAFGSGHHATTLMCLEFLDSMDLKSKRVLDVGCGSGILGIASRMLGAKVEICDTDSLALEESHKNFTLNTCLFDASWIGSINQAKGEYDVIVANILTHTILMLRDEFYSKLRAGGFLILSGILSEYKQRILDGFVDFKLLAIVEKDDWVAIKLLKFK